MYPLYFYTDYTKAFEGASGFSGSKDVAKKLSAETISHQENGFTSFYLSPKKALNIAEKDIRNYSAYGMENLAIDSSGYTSFSDFSKDGKLTREETIETYNQIFTHLNESVGPTALYEPNVYAWAATDKYLRYSNEFVELCIRNGYSSVHANRIKRVLAILRAFCEL